MTTYLCGEHGEAVKEEAPYTESLNVYTPYSMVTPAFDVYAL